MDETLIFSLNTSRGQFEISTPRATFNGTSQTYGQTYILRADFDPELCGTYDEPYDAIRAVAQHQTGCEEWDCSGENVSDYAGDWTRHPSKKFKMDVMVDYIQKRPGCSYRDLIDYFHFKHPYLLDRMEIGELLTELFTTGQLKHPLNDESIPSELRSVHKIALDWLKN